MAANSIEGAAKSLQDCSRILVFDVHGTVLYSTFQVCTAGPKPICPSSSYTRCPFMISTCR